MKRNLYLIVFIDSLANYDHIDELEKIAELYAIELPVFSIMNDWYF